jgi:superfamily II DNA helicase RecQ
MHYLREQESDEEVDEAAADTDQPIFSNVPLESIKEGNYCYLYAHPETLIDNKEIGKMLRGRTMQKLVCAIAIDEVHMVSEW